MGQIGGKELIAILVFSIAGVAVMYGLYLISGFIVDNLTLVSVISGVAWIAVAFIAWRQRTHQLRHH